MTKPAKYLCLRNKFLLFTLLVLLVGCSNKKENAERYLEQYLGVDVPSEFEIIKYEECGLIDFKRHVIVQYSEEDYSLLVSRLTLDDWRRVDKNLLFKNFELSRSERVFLGLTLDDFRVEFTFVIP